MIENNVVQDTSFGGIVFKQLDGGYGWGVRSSRTDSRFTPHTNVVIRGNYLSQTDTDYGCNTIYVTGSQHVLIERNVTKDAGTSAIEIYNVDDARIQYNETFGTVRKAGGADSNGIDTDRATTGAIVQYNYVHDNGDGILVCQFVVRRLDHPLQRADQQQPPRHQPALRQRGDEPDLQQPDLRSTASRART